MLKLTHSFCRSFKLTCEWINTSKTHVKNFSHFTRKCFSCSSIQNISSTLSVVYLDPQLRFFANIKKSNHFKKFNSYDSKKSQKMNESLHPNLNHASYGGQFEISSPDNTEDSFGDTNSNQKQCEIPANFRVWEKVGKKNDTSAGSCRFTVVSYNVLAQSLLECHSYLYTECSPQNLKWDVRAARLYDEIVSLAPDILCLQEVQESHLNTFYSKFEKIGYHGIFKRKTGNKVDGCAIYYKKSMFDLQDQLAVEFYQPELPILNRDNIGLIVKLAPKESPGTPLVVATTHLLYNPKRTDVRLAQMQLMLAELDRFAYFSNSGGCGHHPIILTGDFNSLPHTAVVLLLDRGRVSAAPFRDQSDWRRIGVTDNSQHLTAYFNSQQGLPTHFSMTKIFNSEYSENSPSPPCHHEETEEDFENSQLFNGQIIGHPLNLTSVYNKVKKDGHYEATTFQDYWVTVDYIYYSSLRVVERLRLPTAVECEVLGALPNAVCGSDHLALAAVFELKRTSSL